MTKSLGLVLCLVLVDCNAVLGISPYKYEPTPACDAGSYVDSANQCVACPDGTFSAQAGATECTTWSTCSPGTFVSEAGTATSDQVCADCPEGSYSSQDNVTACTACDAGTYSDVGASSCTSVPTNACVNQSGPGLATPGGLLTNPGGGTGWAYNFFWNGSTSVSCGLNLTNQCASGELNATPSFNGGTNLTVGFNLNDTASTPLAYSQTITSLSVTWSGTISPANAVVRADVFNHATGAQYCVDISAARTANLQASDFTLDCWNAGGTTWDGTGATNFDVSLQSATGSNVTFTDFCVGSLTINPH